jgi:hypothetical protein
MRGSFLWNKNYYRFNLMLPKWGANVKYAETNRFLYKSLFKIWNCGVINATILPCRLEKSPKIGPQFEPALRVCPPGGASHCGIKPDF